MIRRYWFEGTYVSLWLLAAALLFFRTAVSLPVAVSAFTLCGVGFAFNLWNRRFREAVFILAAPLLVIPVILSLQKSEALDWVEFQLARPALRDQVILTPTYGGQPRLIAFAMDDRGWQVVGSSVLRPSAYMSGDDVLETLVYDESGEILRPAEERSDAWRLRAAGRPYFHNLLRPVTLGHSVHVTPMGGGWYWVEQIFPRGPVAC